MGLVVLVSRGCADFALSLLLLAWASRYVMPYDTIVISMCLIRIVSIVFWSGGDSAVARCRSMRGLRRRWRKRPSDNRDGQGDNGGNVLRKVRTAHFGSCPMGDANEGNDASAPCC